MAYLKISSNQVNKNMVLKFNDFYKSLGENYLNEEHKDNLEKLRNAIAMVIIASKEPELVDILVEVWDCNDD